MIITPSMFAFDPTITTGNVLTMVAVVASAAIFISRQSYVVGGYKKEFDHVHRDLEEIKQAIKEQDKVFRAKEHADALADGIIRVMQQRILTLEEEVKRARGNIHRLANVMQVKIARLEDED